MWVQFFKHKKLIIHKYLPTYYRKKARARSLSKQRICTPTAIVRQIFTGTGKIENLTNFDNYFSYYTIINCHPDMRSKIGRYQYSTDKDIFHISPSERLIGRPLPQTPSLCQLVHIHNIHITKGLHSPHVIMRVKISGKKSTSMEELKNH